MDYYTGDTVFDDLHGSMTMGVSGTRTFVGALEFVDSESPDRERRFYRARSE